MYICVTNLLIISYNGLCSKQRNFILLLVFVIDMREYLFETIVLFV